MNRDPGRLIATYRGSLAFAFVSWVLTLLLAGTGGFLLWLAHQARTGALTFTGDITLLDKLGFGGLALAALSLVIFSIVKWRRVTVHLHEHAIRAEWPNRAQIDFFDEIEDVYLPPVRLFGYRTRPGLPWVMIDHRVARLRELKQRVIDAQIAHRVPVLRFQVQQGGAATFRYFSAVDNAQQILLGPRNVSHPTHDLAVSAHAVVVAGKALPLGQLARVDRGGLPVKLTIRDVRGAVFHGLPASSLLSSDLLQALLEAMRRAHAHQPAA